MDLPVNLIIGNWKCHMEDSTADGFHAVTDAQYTILSSDIGAHFPMNVVETVAGPGNSQHTFTFLVDLTILSYIDSGVLCNYHTVKCTSDIPCGQGNLPDPQVNIALLTNDSLSGEIAQGQVGTFTRVPATATTQNIHAELKTSGSFNSLTRALNVKPK